jgi:hypothetical protein
MKLGHLVREQPRFERYIFTKLYLSSSFSERESGEDDLLQMRSDLQARGRRWGVEVVLAEQDEDIMAAHDRGDDPAVLEGCARLMGECGAFFGMLFERHGTKVAIELHPAEVRTSVSFFEAELLEASITSKPICIVRSRGLPPSAPMEEFLGLVSASLGRRIATADRHELTETFDAFCRDLAKRPADGSVWLLDAVSSGRIRRSIGWEAADPQLSFLAGVFRQDGGGTFSEEVLRKAIGRVDAGIGSGGKPLSQLARLSYLWMAMRELARLQAKARLDHFGEEFQRALELWNSSAAWYGLHGAHPMGCLAALNELTHVRTELKSADLPMGARASAYYSIGAKVRSKWAARRFFRQSFALSRAKLAQQPDDPSELLQMTASAHAQLARLGQPWRYALALRDFRKSLDWRSSHGAPQESIGEAMNAYAFALSKQPWRRKEALALAAEGSAMIRDSAGGLASGFYFRSERKRAEMLGRAGHLDEAIVVAAAARELAANAQAFDQARPLGELLASLKARKIES